MPTSFLPDLGPISALDQTVILLGVVGLTFIVVNVLSFTKCAVVADILAIRRIALPNRPASRQRSKAA